MEWISVQDRLPDETDKYRIKSNKSSGKSIWFICDVNGGKSWGSKLSKGEIVTHWMPLPPKPEPPKK